MNERRSGNRRGRNRNSRRGRKRRTTISLLHRRKPWRLVLHVGICTVGTLLVLGMAGMLLIGWWKKNQLEKPDKLLVRYMNDITEKKYEEMYHMLDTEESRDISLEEFQKRNAAIYEGIEIQNMKISQITYNKKEKMVAYHTSFDTVAGNVNFDNQAFFTKQKDGYHLIWQERLIFPGLEAEDKVRVSRKTAERGEILDRNGTLLAGKGTASQVGLVPEKMQNREEAVSKIADILDMSTESIEKQLSAKWVKEDSFVPIKIISKASEIKWKSPIPEESEVEKHTIQEQLLEIPGVMITDTKVREYPMGEAAAHLIGYVQAVTAEDLETHKGEGYSANSVMGKSGMEGLYEKELKGQDGCSITIENTEGNEKEALASVPLKNGETIKLTIDAKLQRELYEEFQEDKSCSVAMNPYTGEVLALVSTPSFNNNDFIMGMSEAKWNTLNQDEKKPMYNRFRQKWCPGSSFKPVIAAIGLQTGAFTAEENFGTEGLSWQKDESWGAYKVTTLHDYEPVILKNALIYSDNIYFAKAALKIGANSLKKELQKLGFGEKIPFEITMAASQYSNTEHIETEIQLADSGYGQGQVLINPLHLASIYTSFVNQGNIIKPYLRYQEEPKKEVWIAEAFSKEAVKTVTEGMEEVISNPHGTGYEAYTEGRKLAGKTGTAEIKESKEDTSGTELGWFAVFTEDDTIQKPVLLISMVEDVKGIGGSGYVVRKDKKVLDTYLQE